MTDEVFNTADGNAPIHDVIIVGAGLSGIGAGYHIQTKCPGKSFTILEGRSTIGGTWDLFKFHSILFSFSHSIFHNDIHSRMKNSTRVDPSH